MWNDRIIEAFRLASSGIFDLSAFGLGRYSLDEASSRLDACNSILQHLKYFPYEEREAVALEIGKMGKIKIGPGLMMTRQQLRALRNLGMELGAHTASHPILECLPDHQAEAEIRNGKIQLETMLDEDVTAFAYPNGRPDKDYSTRHAEMVRQAGFLAAVSTEQAIATASSEIFQLPRFTPWDVNLARFALRCGLSLIRADGGSGAMPSSKIC